MAFDVGAILGRLVLDTTQWFKSATAVKKSQQQMTVQTKKVGTSFSKMWQQVAIGAGVTTLISRGMRAMGREMADVFQKGREFEKEWANVTTMLSISRGETAKMRDELRRLSPTLGDTADLARGMYQVLSASIEPAKAIKFLGTAAKAAKAGITDTRTAVDAITTVINAYGMEAEDATEVSDIMFSTVKRGKLTFAEMATSLGTVVPVASKVGLSFKEVAAAMATLTRQGIDSRTATMQLRQVIMSILSPTDDAIKLAENLGFEWSIDALQAGGLSKMLSELEEKTGGNNELLKEFVPNVRALTAVMGLGGEAAEGFAEDLSLMEEATGKTDEAFSKQMETMDFWLEAAEVTRDKWKIAFYEGLISPMRESIQTAEDFEKKFTETSNNVADAISLQMSATVEGVKGTAKVVKDVTTVVKTWFKLWTLGLIDVDRESRETTTATDELSKAIQRLRATKAGETFTDITVKAEETTEVIKDTKEEIVGFATSFEDVWARIQAVELDILWGKFAKMVEKTEMVDAEMINLGDDTKLTAIKMAESIGWMVDESAISLNTLYELNEERTKKEMGLFEKIGTASMIALGQSKAGAIAQAIMSTYAGAAKTIELIGMPWAIPFVAMAILQGMAQVKKIMEVDIPSAAEGGFMPKPAIIEAGHGTKGEVILPLDKAPGMSQRIVIQNTIVVGEQTFYNESVRSVNKAGTLGDLIIPHKVVV